MAGENIDTIMSTPTAVRSPFPFNTKPTLQYGGLLITFVYVYVSIEDFPSMAPIVAQAYNARQGTWPLPLWRHFVRSCVWPLQNIFGAVLCMGEWVVILKCHVP